MIYKAPKSKKESGPIVTCHEVTGLMNCLINHSLGANMPAYRSVRRSRAILANIRFTVLDLKSTKIIGKHSIFIL